METGSSNLQLWIRQGNGRDLLRLCLCPSAAAAAAAGTCNGCFKFRFKGRRIVERASVGVLCRLHTCVYIRGVVLKSRGTCTLQRA